MACSRHTSSQSSAAACGSLDASQARVKARLLKALDAVLMMLCTEALCLCCLSLSKPPSSRAMMSASDCATVYSFSTCTMFISCSRGTDVRMGCGRSTAVHRRGCGIGICCIHACMRWRTHACIAKQWLARGSAGVESDYQYSDGRTLARSETLSNDCLVTRAKVIGL